MVKKPETIYGYMAEFATAEQLLEAARRTSEAGYRRIDAFAPFPIEGLAEAIGFQRTRLPLVVLLAGIVGLPFSSMYSASKFAMEGLTESLRLETWRYGIRVVLVEPGDFRTNFTSMRRFTKASAMNGTYQQALERTRAAQEREETNGPTPESIGFLVEKILRSHNPRLRYSVGMLSQRIVVPCKRLLPQRLFEWLLCRVLGIE